MKKPNIIGNILYQVSYELFAMLLPLFTAPFISRMLGADMLGVYSYSRTLATYFGLFGMLGVKNYGNREISVHRDTGDLNIWFWSIYSVQFLASLLMLIVYLGYTFFFVREDQAVTAVQAILIVDSMLDISWFLFGMEQFKKTTTCSMVVKILTTAAVFLMIREPGDLLKYCLIMSGGTFINQLLLWFYARKLVGRPVFDGGRVLAHVKPMLILFIPVVAVSLYTMMDKLMLGAMSTNAQMGFYEASERIILCASSVITAFGTVMMPRMTKLFSDGDLRESQRYMKLSVDAIMAIAKKHDLRVIEDCAQACGATYKGKFVGTFGDCGCFSFQYHKTITAGEGGALLTNDDRLYARACSYHDTAACWRPDRFAPQRFEGELFCGSNFRMSELCGAVMCAQLDRLDYLNEAMRSHLARIKSQIKDTKGIKVRPCHDEAGDTGICLMFFLDSREKVGPFVDALKAEGVAAGGIFNAGIPDWHIYAHWKHVIEEKAPTDVKCPWVCPYHKAEPVQYAADMCPNTLDYLGRVVHLDLPAQMTDEDCDMIAKAINKVAAVLA